MKENSYYSVAFHLYDHEDQEHGERDRKIDFGELENVINGIFKLFGSNLRELHNQHEQNEKEFTDKLTHNRAVEIFKVLKTFFIADLTVSLDYLRG